MRFQVTLTGSTKPLTATLVGTYPTDDLAVIKVSGAKNLHPATFADSSKVQIGDIVLAMGNPLGLSGSVTNGIVSAVDRTVSEPTGGGSPGATLPETIQTSAAINPGNSGGALVNLNGDVIGIPTLAANAPQGGAAPGIGFAIASNIVKDVAGQIAANGKVVTSHRATLGIRATTVTDASGKPAGTGVHSTVPGGPAEAAGLQTGDVITALNGSPTPTVQALSSVLANLQPGKSVPLEVVLPDGSKKTVNVTLGTLPD
ncbi:MAG: S1C family serine protease [Actinomycetales bacterium]